MTTGLKPLFSLAVEVGKPVVVDAGEHGRRYIPITGGTVSGVYTGMIVPGGADWQFILPNGRIDLEARYVLDIDDHGAVEVLSQGLRDGPPEVLAALARGEAVDPSQYYFRTAMRFRTAAPGLARFNAIIAIASGRRDKSIVRLEVAEVL